MSAWQAAKEPRRVRRIDRQVFAVEELGEEQAAAIRKAQIPQSKRYKIKSLTR